MSDNYFTLCALRLFVKHWDQNSASCFYSKQILAQWLLIPHLKSCGHIRVPYLKSCGHRWLLRLLSESKKGEERGNVALGLAQGQHFVFLPCIWWSCKRSRTGTCLCNMGSDHLVAESSGSYNG